MSIHLNDACSATYNYKKVLPTVEKQNNGFVKSIQVKLKNFIFPDYKALFHLDLLTDRTLEYCECTVPGFELYVIEQWVYERQLSVAIVSYTGNTQDIIHGVKISLPEDPNNWPNLFKEYYDTISNYIKLKSIDNQTVLFITDLSFFPSTLNLLHITCGSLKSIWPVFKINLGLKRLQCCGRSSLLLSQPSSASIVKFTQLYRINTKKADTIPDTVLGLITLIQKALCYFKLLNPEYIDGIFCQYTEKAINEWWLSYGRYYLGIERPKNEGILGPTTVAALISLVLSCYFKFVLEGCISSKDPFDEEAFYSGIFTFQKEYGLKKTSRLDIKTLDKLLNVTNKISNKDIFKLKTVLKSTMQDITGKGNLIQLSTEILTSDLDKLIHNMPNVGCLAYLWKGRKPHLEVEKEFTMCYFKNGDPTTKTMRTEKIINSCSIKKEDSPNNIIITSNNINEFSKFIQYNDTQTMVNDTWFQREAYRRSSIPHMNMETNIFQSKYTNYTYSKIEPMMKRTNSFSMIECSISTWSLPFEPSSVKIARELISLEYEISKVENNQTIDNSGKLDLENTAKVFNSEYSMLSNQFNELLFEKGTLTKKHHILLEDIHELESLEAKFKYDIRILENRMRDVEDSIEQFKGKLQTIEENILGHSPNGLSNVDMLSNLVELEGYARDALNRQKSKYESFSVSLITQIIWPRAREGFMRLYIWFIGKK